MASKTISLLAHRLANSRDCGAHVQKRWVTMCLQVHCLLQDRYLNNCTSTYFKDRTIPVTGWGDPQVCEKSMPPQFIDNWLTDCCEVLSLASRLSFSPQENFGYSFLFIGWIDARAIVHLERLDQLKKCTDVIENQSHDFATCSTVPQQTRDCVPLSLYVHMWALQSWQEVA
jgi:hypothetical protein